MKRIRATFLLMVLCMLAGCAAPLPTEPVTEALPLPDVSEQTFIQETFLPEEDTGFEELPKAGEEYSWDSDAEYEYIIYGLEEGLYEVLMETGADFVRFWYDQEEQVLFASITLPESVSADWIENAEVTLEDVNGDDNEDLLITQYAADGNACIHCFLWDPQTMDLQDVPSAEYSRILSDTEST